MKKLKTGMALVGLLVMLIISGCGNDDMGNPTGNQIVFNLKEKDNSGVSGVVAFIELDNGTTLVRINVSGTQAGNSHPVHIHLNNWVDTGEIAVFLNDIDGATGESETVVSTTTDNVRIRYADLDNFNGYVNVHKSIQELEVEIAQVDIGQNALTGVETTYPLTGTTEAGWEGAITLCKRKNNQTLVKIAFDEEISTTEAIPFLFSGAIDGEGSQVAQLGTFNSLGNAFANITSISGSPTFTYDNFVEYNGHVRVQEAGTSTVLSQGNIGVNVE
jgi:hypothetical protein